MNRSMFWMIVTLVFTIVLVLMYNKMLKRDSEKKADDIVDSLENFTSENYNPSCAGDHQQCSIDHKCIPVKGKCKGTDVTGCKLDQVCDGEGKCVYLPNKCDVDDVSKCGDGRTRCVMGHCSFPDGKCDPKIEKSCFLEQQSCNSNGDCYYPEGVCLNKSYCKGDYAGFDCTDSKCVPPSSWEC